MECFTLIGKVPNLKITFWVGKNDFLIHQCSISKAAMQALPVDDAMAESILKSHNLPVTPETLAMAKVMAGQQMQQFLEMPVTLTETEETITPDTSSLTKDFNVQVPPGLKPSQQFP